MSARQKMAKMGDEELRAHLLVCCHAAKWADKLVQEKPFGSREELMQRSSDIWLTMEDSDLMEVSPSYCVFIGPCYLSKHKWRLV
jgi:hypothetical protein